MQIDGRYAAAAAGGRGAPLQLGYLVQAACCARAAMLLGKWAAGRLCGGAAILMLGLSAFSLHDGAVALTRELQRQTQLAGRLYGLRGAKGAARRPWPADSGPHPIETGISV